MVNILCPKVFVITVDQHGDPREKNSWGEAQRWVEGGIDQPLKVPGLDLPLFHDSTSLQCLMITGLAKSNCAISVTAAVLSGRIDLRSAYILITGIGGSNPEHASTGSVAWSRWVVDGGLASIVAQSELPSDFEFPYFPMGCTTPWCQHETPFVVGTEVYQLNQSLAEWAYATTQHVDLVDSEASRQYRAPYSQPDAVRAPFVLLGDAIGSDTWFHGNLLGDWASRWMAYWTRGRGEYVISDLEDCAIIAALDRLSKAGFLDFEKVLLARGSSNFDRPYPGQTVIEAIKAAGGRQNAPNEADRLFVAGEPALENVYRAGRVVADKLLKM